MPKETDMKTVTQFTLAVLTIGALLGMSGCTDLSSRNTLTVDSVNGGNTYLSDLINNIDPLNPFIPVDQVKVIFGNIRNGGGDPIKAGAPFSEIVVTGYTVTYDNGIFTPVVGGLNVRVSSGSTNEATILLSNSGEKGALIGMTGTVTTIARIHFTGYNYINGYDNGDAVYADAALSVQIGDFGDK
ncbi:MAG TPA: hypothetical protein VER77_02495 [Candidatus Dormibacteraeota bacterium]|nr:hypothetical protein [Candidatus Dormibacteraeota bacterium]